MLIDISLLEVWLVMGAVAALFAVADDVRVHGHRWGERKDVAWFGKRLAVVFVLVVLGAVSLVLVAWLWLWDDTLD